MASLEIRRRDGTTHDVLIDDEDLDRVRAVGSWCVMRASGGLLYAVHPNHPSNLPLHRFIMNAVDGEFVDHREPSATLDNRKSNLRKCTKAENTRNQRMHRDNRSGFKGVTFCKKTGRWRALICANYKVHHLGRFDTPELAHAAYCKAADDLHGEFARTS